MILITTHHHNRFLSVITGLVAGFFLLLVVRHPAADAAKQLCADDSGVFVGLATDEDAYESIPGSVGPDADSVVQSWELTAEGSKGPRRSYDGRYLQVLPDSGRSYPARGQHIKHASELDGTSPYVSFSFRVNKKDGAGVHTLFLRWTGGDTVGAGDSFYVVLYKQGKSKGAKTLVNGEQTVKPIVMPIESTMSKYAGCCYDMETHACPCYSEQPDEATCKKDGFVERKIAAEYGVQCFVGGGAMEIIKFPEWYLFAGQEAGSVMDFDSEPWDASCEADGSNTKDSGHDFPSWILDGGEYELRIYAREDGTALDGIYIAGPNGSAPSISKRYEKGDSTTCPPKKANGGKMFLLFAFIAIGISGLAYYVYVRRTGHHLPFMMSSAMLETPAQVVRYDQMIDNSLQFSTES